MGSFGRIYCVRIILHSLVYLILTFVFSAFWATTAWTSFVASNTQATANFLLTELVVFESDFPALGDDTDIRWRALVWGVSVAFLLLAIISNYLPRTFAVITSYHCAHPSLQYPARAYTWVFRASMGIIVIDFLLTFIWLPIGVSQTYGFQSAEWVFTERKQRYWSGRLFQHRFLRVFNE